MHIAHNAQKMQRMIQNTIFSRKNKKETLQNSANLKKKNHFQNEEASCIIAGIYELEVRIMDQRSNKLLKLLEKDCTLTPAQLAAMCDTNEEDVTQRIRSLTAEGVLLGYKAVVNWEKTAVEAVEALIEVKVTPQRDKGFDRIAERIYQYEEVESCYLMSGGYDLTVILTGRTLREVALFVSQKLSTIEGVTSTATHFILKKYKQQNVVFEQQEEQKERLIFV